MENIIKKLGIPQNFNKGDFLLQAGDIANGFFLIEKGLVRIYKMDEQAKEIEIGRIGPGGFLGEAIIFVQDTYPVYAQAVKKIDCLCFSKEQILTAISNNSEIAKFLFNF